MLPPFAWLAIFGVALAALLKEVSKDQSDSVEKPTPPPARPKETPPAPAEPEGDEDTEDEADDDGATEEET